MRKFERTSGKPIYQQLADWIREEIQSGNVPQGKDLGTHAEVASHHGVKPNIAERALNQLQTEGWILRNRDDIRKVTRPREAAGVLLKWDPADLRLEAEGPLEVKVLSKMTTSLSADLLKIFEVHGVDGTRASRIVKLHLSGKTPLALETITAPMNDLPGLVMKDHRLTNLYAIIRNHYAIEVESVEQRIHQRMLKPEEANNLGATP
ncbi:MAG: GntR family transcriptional regulator, partial [Candidatus Omnitrophica bacterium]|nr:GntR family transcriptional regulator [Candidatus Omnitrophota bacterium]